MNFIRIKDVCDAGAVSEGSMGLRAFLCASHPPALLAPLCFSNKGPRKSDNYRYKAITIEREIRERSKESIQKSKED